MTNDFRLTTWKDSKDKPFAVVLTGTLDEKAIKISIFKRSIHVTVNHNQQKRIRSKNSQFIEDCCHNNVNMEAINAFFAMAHKAGMF